MELVYRRLILLGVIPRRQASVPRSFIFRSEKVPEGAVELEAIRTSRKTKAHRRGPTLYEIKLWPGRATGCGLFFVFD
jgi:hypothetical protein